MPRIKDQRWDSPHNFDFVDRNFWVLFQTNPSGYERYWTGENDEKGDPVTSRYLHQAYSFESAGEVLALVSSSEGSSALKDFTMGRRPRALNVGVYGRKSPPPGKSEGRDWKAIRLANAVKVGLA